MSVFKRSTIFIFALMLCFSLTSISSFTSEQQTRQPAPKVGQKAPQFSGKTINGDELELEKLRGKVVLVDFWASWCGPCRSEIPHLQEVYEEFHKKGFEILSVNVNENESKIKAFTKQTEMPWKHIVDEDGKISALYQVQFIPAPFLIDHTGKLVAEGASLRGKNLQKTIEKYVKKLPETE